MFATIAVLAVVVALGAWALISTVNGGSDAQEASRAAATATTDSSGSPSATSSGATSSGASSSGASSSGASSSASSEASSVMGTCEAEVAAGKAAVEAANQSYKDWSAHVKAQVDFDARRISRDQTLAIWAQTKANGPSDVAAFDSAYAAYQPLSGSCAKAVQGTAGRPVQQCLTSARALADAVAAGQKVNADWAAHVTMMANKQAIGSMYSHMWREMVNAAPTNLDPFKAAYQAQAAAPSCAG